MATNDWNRGNPLRAGACGDDPRDVDEALRRCALPWLDLLDVLGAVADLVEVVGEAGPYTPPEDKPRVAELWPRLAELRDAWRAVDPRGGKKAAP